MFAKVAVFRRPKTPTSKETKDGEKIDVSNPPPAGLFQRLKASLGASPSLHTLTDSSNHSKVSLPISIRSGQEAQEKPYARSIYDGTTATSPLSIRSSHSRGPSAWKDKTPESSLRIRHGPNASTDTIPLDLLANGHLSSSTKSGIVNPQPMAAASSSRASLLRRKTDPDRPRPGLLSRNFLSGPVPDSNPPRSQSLPTQERDQEDHAPPSIPDVPPLPKPLVEPPEEVPSLSRGPSSKSIRNKPKPSEESDSPALPPPLTRRRSSTKPPNQVYRIPAGGQSVPVLPHSRKKPSSDNREPEIPPLPRSADSKRASYPSQFDVVIAVLGMTGAGKSFFIDKATRGGGQGIGHTLASHTTEITTRQTIHPITGKSVLFVDTPGFDDTELSDANEILEMISKWLEENRAGEVKLAGIFYLHPISDNRMTGTALKNLRMFQKLCGKDALEKVVLLTTCWDEVGEHVGPRREKELIESFWSKMIRNRSQVARFDQSFESAWKAVDLLLSTTASNDTMPLNFMTNVNSSRSAESAGEPSPTDDVFSTDHGESGVAAEAQPPVEPVTASPEDLVFLVMGMTGAGKSSFINKATRGNGQEVGDSLTSHTTQIVSTRTTHPKTGKSVLFVDTPGFDNTHLSDTEVLQTISRWLEETYTDGIKLSGIFYLHPISDQRVAGTTLANLRMFEKLCGKNASQKVVFLTTFWDDIEETIGFHREDKLKKSCWASMIRNQSQVARFNQTFESAWEATDLLLSRRGRPTLQLQKELVDEGKELRGTQAGAALLNTLEELLARQQIALKNLLEERKEESDPRYSKEIDQELAELQKKIKLTVDQMQSLKAPLPTTLRTLKSFFRRVST